MAASYPTSVKSFSTVVNGTTKLVASLFNTPNDEITAIETDILNAAADYGATSTIVGFSSVATKQIFYKRVGKFVFIVFYITGTSNATNLTFTVPYTSVAGLDNYIGVAYGVDNSANQTAASRPSLPPSSATVTVTINFSGASVWTNSGTKTAGGFLWYEAV